MLKRIIKKVINKVVGSNPPPPTPQKRYTPPPPPKWMAQELEHDHNHSHDHDHAHDHDHTHNQQETSGQVSTQSISAIDITAIETPNPNAYKFSVSQKVSDKSFSASNLKQASGNPIAEQLLAHQAVQSIFGVNDFITVTKKQEANWPDIIPEITAIIQKALEQN